jgi:hypothetical protein
MSGASRYLAAPSEAKVEAATIANIEQRVTREIFYPEWHYVERISSEGACSSTVNSFPRLSFTSFLPETSSIRQIPLSHYRLADFDVGLKPFINLSTTSGKEGSTVGISGQGFSASSVVEFDGVKATKTVLSGTTYITATVPAGALTGQVTVTTGTTTLTSTKTFKVLPTITSKLPESSWHRNGPPASR